MNDEFEITSHYLIKNVKYNSSGLLKKMQEDDVLNVSLFFPTWDSKPTRIEITNLRTEEKATYKSVVGLRYLRGNFELEILK